MGEDLDDLSMDELFVLEQRMDSALELIRDRKVRFLCF